MSAVVVAEDTQAGSSENDSSDQHPGNEEEGGESGAGGGKPGAGGGKPGAGGGKPGAGGGKPGAGGGKPGAGGGKPGASGLSAAQQEVLERCLHTLTHAKNDSHTLAALLLITRLCPAGQLDSVTLRRIFEAVGLSLPARLLVTAVRGGDGSGLPPEELLSLGTALLAALSTDPDMAAHPQLLATVPLLLGLLADGPALIPQKQAAEPDRGRQGEEQAQPAQATSITKDPDCKATSVPADGEAQSHQNKSEDGDAKTPSTSDKSAAENGAPTTRTTKLDEALAADCYQILTTVCALPQGPAQLLARGAIPSLCRALDQNQTLSREKGLPLLGCLLSGKTRERAWSKYPAELLSLLATVSKDFCQATDDTRLDLCVRLPQFLPPATRAPESGELKDLVVGLWATLRPTMQARLTAAQLGPVLVLSGCLLDLCGWGPIGPPRFCCLLVNRACVEVRMGLEEPPGTDTSPELQQTLTACYRIMEAAMEQACSQGVAQSDAQPPSAIAGLSLQQSRQVLRVLEEAFSAIIYHLQQVDQSRYGDPFVFVTFRSLCSWLAEETSCLKEEVTALLPFLVGYASSHLQGEGQDKGLSNWMSEMAVSDGSQGGAWTGRDALRYLLPALCHLSAEEGPRKVLLTLDTPALLVAFLSQAWSSRKPGGTSARDPSMETACSALLNFAVTEPERVRKDQCFRTLELLLSEALPVLLHKPHLLVLAANCCTLGLMIGRLKHTATGTVEAGQRRFFSSALRFLGGALDSSSSPGPARVSPVWEEWWEEAGELWRLGLQALGGCVRAQPWITSLAREEGWLRHNLSLLASCSALPDPHTQEALEEALCAIVDQCPLCRQEISSYMKGETKGAFSRMGNLRKTLATK